MAATRYHLAAPVSVLWRPDGALQVGLDAEGALVLPGAPPGADTAVRALRRPRTLLEVSRIVPSTPVEWIRAALDALCRGGVATATDAVPAPVPGPVAVVLGGGVLADAVSEVLVAEGLAVRVEGAVPPPGAGPVVVCPSTIEAERAGIRDLWASGRPHLVVRAEPERAVVGPFVRPGLPCLTCSDLVRRAVDPAWPHLLAQLCRTQHTPSPTQAAWCASLASAQLRTWAAGDDPETSGTTLELDTRTGRLGLRRWPPHPDCACTLAAG